MIRLLALAGVLVAAGALAQAPTEERLTPGGNKVSEGQQRIEFLRRELDANRETVRRAELELNETRNRESTLQKQLEAARKQRETSSLNLDRVRRQLVITRKAYDNESMGFERMLKGGATNGTRNPVTTK